MHVFICYFCKVLDEKKASTSNRPRAAAFLCMNVFIYIITCSFISDLDYDFAIFICLAGPF